MVGCWPSKPGEPRFDPVLRHGYFQVPMLQFLLTIHGIWHVLWLNSIPDIKSSIQPNKQDIQTTQCNIIHKFDIFFTCWSKISLFLTLDISFRKLGISKSKSKAQYQHFLTPTLSRIEWSNAYYFRSVRLSFCLSVRLSANCFYLVCTFFVSSTSDINLDHFVTLILTLWPQMTSHDTWYFTNTSCYITIVYNN